MEYDIKYPEHLHDLHAEWPYVVEKIAVRNEYINSKMKDYMVFTKPLTRLTATFLPKKNYCVAAALLRFMLDKGIRVLRYISILRCDRTNKIQQYMNRNLTRKAASTNTVQSNMFKALNNGFFGYSIQNISKREDNKYIKVGSTPVFNYNLEDPANTVCQMGDKHWTTTIDT